MTDVGAASQRSPLCAGVVVEIEAQYVEIYRDKMYDLLKASGRALDKSCKAQPPAALGARGLANASRVPLTDASHMLRCVPSSALPLNPNLLAREPAPSHVAPALAPPALHLPPHHRLPRPRLVPGCTAMQKLQIVTRRFGQRLAP